MNHKGQISVAFLWKKFIHLSFLPFSVTLPHQYFTSFLHVSHLSLSWREQPSCSSALPNQPEWDSLADSCSRWHYYSMVSQSSGTGSSTSRGSSPYTLPTHQHQHMAVLCNTLPTGWYVSRITQQVLSFSYNFRKICVEGLFSLSTVFTCMQKCTEGDSLLSWR